MAKNGKAKEVDHAQLMRNVLTSKDALVHQAQQELAKLDGQLMGIFLASGWSPEEANEALGQEYFQIQEAPTSTQADI